MRIFRVQGLGSMGSYELETKVRLGGPTGGCIGGLRETLMECTATLVQGSYKVEGGRNSRAWFRCRISSRMAPQSQNSQMQDHE